MKTALLVVSILLISTSIVCGQIVNGDTTTIDGKKILKVWGTHYERGYAQGFLMGVQIKRMFDEYVIAYIFQNNIIMYNSALGFYNTFFSVEEKYEQEVSGMFAGMVDAGISLYNTALNRELNVTDGLMVCALGDLSGMVSLGIQGNYQCSTLSSWGSSTAGDPELNGGLVVTRNFDWDMHPTLLENHLLTVNFPAETDEVNWINIGFPGLIAPFSALNQEGTAAFQNVGNYNTQTVMETFHPISFSIRNGIELLDYNGDLVNNNWDVAEAIEDEYTLSSWVITAATLQEAVIVECNNERRTIVRDQTCNSTAPVIPVDNIAATNHHRLLYPPVYCYRYENISDSLAASGQVNIDRSWDILTGAAGVPTNVHTVQFAPSLNLLKWSAAPNPWTPAYTQPPTVFDLDELFEPPSGIEYRSHQPVCFSLTAYPNPFNSSTVINYKLTTASYMELKVYDVMGRETASLVTGHSSLGYHEVVFDAEGLSSGVYFVRLTVNSGQLTVKKVLLLK